MINENSLHSVAIVLLLFGVIYFIALGIYELKKWIQKKIAAHKEKNSDVENNKKEDE